MSISWNDKEKTLLECIRSKMSTREINKVYTLLSHPRSVNAIQKQSRKLGLKFKDFGKPSVSGLSQEERFAVLSVVKKRDNLVIQLAPVKTVKPSSKGSITTKVRESTNSMLSDLKEIRKQVGRHGSISTKIASGNKDSLVIMLSDWHFGQTISNPETGEEIYNSLIATERIKKIPTLIREAFTKDKLKQIDECVLLLIGDMVSGEGIFKGQEMELDQHAAAQVKNATTATWIMIQELREMFPLVRIVTTRGNHGRTNASPEANWDNIIYQQLELLIDLDEGKDITIKNRYGEYGTLDIKGWRGLIRHHAPVQADTAGAIAKFAGWHGIHNWDLFCFAHYHHWGVMTWNTKPIYRNGALAGGDSYAETLAKYDQPSQLCFIVNEETPCSAIVPLRFE